MARRLARSGGRPGPRLLVAAVEAPSQDTVPTNVCEPRRPHANVRVHRRRLVRGPAPVERQAHATATSHQRPWCVGRHQRREPVEAVRERRDQQHRQPAATAPARRHRTPRRRCAHPAMARAIPATAAASVARSPRLAACGRAPQRGDEDERRPHHSRCTGPATPGGARGAGPATSGWPRASPRPRRRPRTRRRWHPSTARGHEWPQRSRRPRRCARLPTVGSAVRPAAQRPSATAALAWRAAIARSVDRQDDCARLVVAPAAVSALQRRMSALPAALCAAGSGGRPLEAGEGQERPWWSWTGSEVVPARRERAGHLRLRQLRDSRAASTSVSAHVAGAGPA